MTVSSAQVSVTTTATRLDPVVDPMRNYSLLVRNRGAADVYVGSSGVTSGTGCLVPVNEDISVVLGPGEILYGITASGTANCHVLKVGGPG